MKLKTTKEYKDFNNNAVKLHEARFSQIFLEQSQPILLNFQERMRADYMLDFTIWKYMFYQKQIQKLKDTIDEYYLEDNKDFIKYNELKIQILDKIKKWRILLTRFDNQLFS